MLFRSRREGIRKVLEGIEAALKSPVRVRLNALLLRNINLEDCIPLVHYARDLNVFIRFIEFMPLDASRAWNATQVVTGKEVRERVESVFGPLEEVSDIDLSQPSKDFRFRDGRGGIGFISPVSEPFCASCNRLRLTADGKFRNCLFGTQEWDVKGLLEPAKETDRDLVSSTKDRLPMTSMIDDEILRIASDCVANKHAAHGISSSEIGRAHV